MKPARITILMATFAMTAMLAMTHTAGASQVNWDEILGLLQSGEVQEGWSPRMLENGKALVNLRNGQVVFEAKGLPLVGPSELEFGFRSEAQPMVKGTLVCNLTAGAEATLVDTPAVPLTSAGEAKFAGHVSLPGACMTANDNLAFFVRPAADASDSQ